MPYLTREEQALFTQATPAKTGIVSSAAGIGLGIAIGSAANSIYATGIAAKIQTMKSDTRTYAGRNFQLAMIYSTKGITEGVTALFKELENGFNDIIDLTMQGQFAGAGGMFANLRDGWRGTSLAMASYNGIVQSVGIDPYTTRQVNMNVKPNIPDVNTAWYAYHINLLSNAEYNEIVAWNGWATKYMPTIAYANISSMSTMTLLELRRRDAISDAEFWGQMRRARFDDGQIGDIYKLLIQMPECYRTADFAAKGIINQSRVQEAFSWYGIAPDWANIWTEAQQVFPDFNTSLSLLRRGKIDVATAQAWAHRNAVPLDVSAQMLALAEQVPSPSEAAYFAAKGIFDDSQMTRSFLWAGLDPSWASSYKWSQQVYPDFNTGLNLLWRGAIDANRLKQFLIHSAIDPVTADNMMVLQEQIPPSNDLVTMVVREAWEPANVTPAPDIFATYMAKRGFSKDWSDRYWTAHWLPMGIQYGYANLHRGFWNKEQFDDLLRIADIHPRWRKAIYNVAFNPPSIREMGYGYDVGVYTVEDIVKYRRWGGLSEVDAAKSGKAMVAYRTEAEREAVRRGYLNLYVLRKIEDDEFVLELTAIGTCPEAIPLWLERGQLARDAQAYQASITEPKAMTRTDAQWLFEHGVKDEDWLRSTLLNLAYEDETVEAYIVQSKQKLTEKAIPTEPKQLTLAQLHTLYSLGKLNDAEYTARLVSMNYSQADAASILELTKESLIVPAPVVKYNEISGSQLSNLYYYGFITRTEFVSRLVGNGYSVDDAELLVSYYLFEMMLGDMKKLYSNGWITKNDMRDELVDSGLSDEVAYGILELIVKAEQPARVATEKDLTKAEIVKGAKSGIISTTSAVGLLESIGYDENEAWYILAINKVISAGDPEGYWDMRRVTESYRKAMGQSSIDIPQELITLEREQRLVKAELDKAKADKLSEIKIGEIAVHLANVNSRMNTIVSKLGIA